MGGSKRSFPLLLCVHRSEDPYIEQEYLLDFKHGLMYNENKKVAKGLLDSQLTPVGTLNDFFAGFFMAKSGLVWRLRWQTQGRMTGEKAPEGRAPEEKVI